jgi:hypothetical protein
MYVRMYAQNVCMYVYACMYVCTKKRHEMDNDNESGVARTLKLSERLRL